MPACGPPPPSPLHLRLHQRHADRKLAIMSCRWSRAARSAAGPLSRLTRGSALRGMPNCTASAAIACAHAHTHACAHTHQRTHTGVHSACHSLIDQQNAVFAQAAFLSQVGYCKGEPLCGTV